MKSITLNCLAITLLAAVSTAALAAFNPSDTSLCAKGFAPDSELCIQENPISGASLPHDGTWYPVEWVANGKLAGTACIPLTGDMPITLFYTGSFFNAAFAARFETVGYNTINVLVGDGYNSDGSMHYGPYYQTPAGFNMVKDAQGAYAVSPNPYSVGVGTALPANALTCPPSGQLPANGYVLARVSA